MIHPMIYASHGDEPGFAHTYPELIRLEAEVAARWRGAIQKMGPTEALVVGSPAQQEFAEFVLDRLGERALILTENVTMDPSLWDGLLGPEAREGLGLDLMGMFWRYGYHWNSKELVQPVIARGWAERVRRTLKERGLTFDPRTVESEGWGESFEGCVATYTSFLRTYLGLDLPIVPRFEMAVPDSRFLFGAEQLKIIPLEHEVLLYIFRALDGRMVGWLHRSKPLIAEPAMYAMVEPRGMALEVWDRNRLAWPSRDSEVRWAEGRVKIPVSRTFFILARSEEGVFTDSLSSADLLVE
jgi:hypothetical protein